MSIADEFALMDRFAVIDAISRRFAEENGDYLSSLRGAVPQKEIAKLARVSQPMVSQLEHGNTYGIGAEKLRRLLAVYAALEVVRGKPGRVPQLRQEGGVQNVGGS